MSSPVTFTWDNLPLGFCWTNPQDFVAALEALLGGTVNINGIVIQPGLPVVGDQDKVWLRTDSSGRPISLYLFQGQWIWPHPVPAGGKMGQIWFGSEADLWAYDGGDGTDPSAGGGPTATTGAMWKRNTDMGSDDGVHRFRFPVGAGKNPTTYEGNQLTIAPGDVGGEERHVLTNNELAAHTHLSGNPINFNFQVDGVAARGVDVGSIASGGDGGDHSHQNMPPWLGVIFAIRTTRQFYTAS